MADPLKVITQSEAIKIVDMVIAHFTSQGRKFKDNARAAIIENVRSGIMKSDLIDLIASYMIPHPKGLKMPWGIYVKP